MAGKAKTAPVVLEETLSEKRRRANLSRKTFGGGGPRLGSGRKRSDKPRCACGMMTARRAKARAHKCGTGK